MPIMAIAAIGSAIIGGVSAAKANNRAKEQNAILQQQTNQQQQLIDQQKEYGQAAYAYANKFLPKADEYLGEVGNYWKKMFSGDAATVNTAMAPEINSYLKSSREGEKALYGLSNRGTVGDRLINLTFDRASDIFNMRANQRNQSGTQLQNLGSVYGALGQNALSSAQGGTASASAALANSMNLTFNRAQAYNSQAASAGMSVGQLLTTFDWGKGIKSIKDIFGGGGGGGGFLGSVAGAGEG